MWADRRAASVERALSAFCVVFTTLSDLLHSQYMGMSPVLTHHHWSDEKSMRDCHNNFKWISQNGISHRPCDQNPAKPNVPCSIALADRHKINDYFYYYYYYFRWLPSSAHWINNKLLSASARVFKHAQVPTSPSVHTYTVRTDRWWMYIYCIITIIIRWT